MVKSKSMKKNQKCKIGLLAFSLSFFVPFFANAIDQGAGKVTANVTQPSKRTIKGVVSDVSGEPLIGVSVLVKGTSIGASTNIDGVYSVEVPNNNAVLEFRRLCRWRMLPHTMSLCMRRHGFYKKS